MMIAMMIHGPIILSICCIQPEYAFLCVVAVYFLLHVLEPTKDKQCHLSAAIVSTTIKIIGQHISCSKFHLVVVDRSTALHAA